MSCTKLKREVVMRSVRVYEHGGPDVLRYETDTPIPEPGPGEVRVRVYAVGINHLDIWTRKGIPGVRLPLPLTLGSDVSGVIDKPGEGVDWVDPGQEVALYPATSCGHCDACLRGNENECPKYAVLGHRRDGGYAEYIVVPARNVLPKPPHLSHAETASLPLVFLTAWHMLVTLAKLQPHDTVLVIAGGSGVGSAAIQIAKFFHARVIATAGSDEKMQRCIELGADDVVNHYEEGWSKKVKKMTQNKGVDVVFEHVGQAVWNEVLRCLAWKGRFVTCGATSGAEVQLNIRYLFGKQWSLYGAYMGSMREMLDAWKNVMNGIFRPVLDRTFPLEQAREAHEYIEAKRHFGKVVLQVHEENL